MAPCWRRLAHVLASTYNWRSSETQLGHVERPAALSTTAYEQALDAVVRCRRLGDVSSTWVRLREGPLEAVDGDVGVDLGRRE